MSVKFKLGFTVSAETIFSLMSRLLPIEDLSVEEVIERPADEHPLQAKGTPFALPLDWSPGWDKQIAKPKTKLKPKAKIRRHFLRGESDRGPNLKTGINGIIIGHLASGMGRHASEFRKLLKAAGYSESSVASRMEELRKHGVVEKIGQGVWRLTEKYVVETQSLPKVATTEAGHASR